MSEATRNKTGLSSLGRRANFRSRAIARFILLALLFLLGAAYLESRFKGPPDLLFLQDWNAKEFGLRRNPENPGSEGGKPYHYAIYTTAKPLAAAVRSAALELERAGFVRRESDAVEVDFEKSDSSLVAFRAEHKFAHSGGLEEFGPVDFEWTTVYVTHPVEDSILTKFKLLFSR